MAVRPRDEHAPDALAHQALRREVNERINEISTGPFGLTEDETIDVICECAQPRCAAPITVTVAEYAAVRRFPTRFFVKTGHRLADGERVVSESAEYVVVESNGASGAGSLYAVGAVSRGTGGPGRDT
jgi:hypothetical protein